jgi:hypothetical protein
MERVYTQVIDFTTVYKSGMHLARILKAQHREFDGVNKVPLKFLFSRSDVAQRHVFDRNAY